MRIPFLTELPNRCLAVTVPFFLAGGLLAQVSGGNSALADKELERRMALVQEGQMLLLKGDEAYNSGNYREASEAYAGARNAFPDAAASAELRSAATTRYVLASVEYGRDLSRKGDVAGAKAAVDKVLEDSVAPDDFTAKAFRAQLDDPIRTNPALTKEHAADVDEVRRLLYTAQGAFDLGKFDEARKRYEDVLRIDPYNKAARRGMQLVIAKISSYSGSAQDQARAEALAMVDEAWELPLSPDLVMPLLPDVGLEGSGEAGFVSVSNKISRIVIPEFRIVQGSLMEAVDLLRLRAAENDTLSFDPAQKGLNITVNLADPASSPAKEILAKTFDLQVNNVPVESILRYLTDITGTAFKTDDFAVTIVPAGNIASELISRTYRVPPDFLSNLSAGSNAASEPEDIFNTDIGEGGLLAARMGARKALAQQGVSFPEGASANFNAATNTMRVVNTPGNQDVIEQIIESISQTEPVSVAVRVTMLKVQQDRLEELGFDWIVTPFGLSNSVFGTGGTLGNGGPRTGNDFINPVNFSNIPGIPVGAGNVSNIVTSGLRSGDQALNRNNIDALLNNPLRTAQNSNVAPGILGLTGLFSDGQVQVIMRGLAQKKGTDLMTAPSVTARSGQKATIEVIREFIYPTEYEPPELPQGGGGGGGGGGGAVVIPAIATPATPTAFEMRATGVTLEIEPTIGANDFVIDLRFLPEIV